MASGIFALFDDIALLADDVALSTKIATQKTAGILGDDLAVNAQKASGFEQKRELKVIWAITKGSFLNKAIILPIAFLLSYFAPFLISVILILGGFYLLFEGSEKIFEFFVKHENKHEKELKNTNSQNILQHEKAKIKSAILTDFILSIEIVILALSTASNYPLIVQIISTSIVSIIATIGVYGIVAMIVRLDNIGFYLIDKNYKKLGQSLVNFMPKLIRALSVIGTIAMILVGGGILKHNIKALHVNIFHNFLDDFIVGLIAGFIILFVIKFAKKIKQKLF